MPFPSPVQLGATPLEPTHQLRRVHWSHVHYYSFSSNLVRGVRPTGSGTFCSVKRAQKGFEKNGFN